MISQFFGQEVITNIQKTGATTLSLNAGSYLRVGGLGLNLKSQVLTLNTASTGLGGLDTGTLANHTLYYVYAAISGSNYGLVASLSKNGPTGFLAYRLIHAFYSDEATQIGALVVNNETDRGIAFTPTFDQASSSSTAVRWWRHGKFLSITGGWTWQSGAGSTWQWYLPTINGAQLVADTPDSNLVLRPFGKLLRDFAGTNNDFVLIIDDTIPNRMRLGRTQDAGAAPLSPRTGLEITNGHLVRTYAVKIPIVGWEDKII